ncbi:ThiF family adenylyltransferase, partial [Streptomyces sp. NPDC002491]
PRRTACAGGRCARSTPSLVENGYAAQPLRTEFGSLPAPSEVGLPGDDRVLAVLRVGRATVPPAADAVRCPVQSSVRRPD